jgi:hypothetical protein
MRSFSDIYAGTIIVCAFMLIAVVAAPLTVSLTIVMNLKDQKLNLIKKIMLSVAALLSTCLAILSLFFIGAKVLDIAEAHDIVDQPIEQVYDVTKTGNQLFFNKKISNSSFIKDVSSEITNEDAENYTFVRHDHVYQIPKSIVNEK